MSDSGLERGVVQTDGSTLVVDHPRLDHIVAFTAQHQAVQPTSYDAALFIAGEDWELIADVKIFLGGTVRGWKKSVPNLGEFHGGRERCIGFGPCRVGNGATKVTFDGPPSLVKLLGGWIGSIGPFDLTEPFMEHRASIQDFDRP